MTCFGAAWLQWYMSIMNGIQRLQSEIPITEKLMKEALEALCKSLVKHKSWTFGFHIVSYFAYLHFWKTVVWSTFLSEGIIIVNSRIIKNWPNWYAAPRFHDPVSASIAIHHQDSIKDRNPAIRCDVFHCVHRLVWFVSIKIWRSWWFC